MGAFDQSKDQAKDPSHKRAPQAKEAVGGKRRRGPEPAGEPAPAPERSGRGLRDDLSRGSGAEFDESARERAQQRIRDAESGGDDNDWV